MKIDRFRRQGLSTRAVKRTNGFHVHVLTARLLIITVTFTLYPTAISADPTHPASVSTETAATSTDILPAGESRGDAVLGQVLNRLVQGPAFNAKLRKRVWTSGREAVGIGTYEQAGQSTGNYNLQVTMHDGVGGQHTLQQISDGRLAWTRSDIADRVLLRRVDIRILEQRVREAGVAARLPPRALVGGLAELIDSIRRDYDLRLKPGAFQLKSNPMRASTVALQTPPTAARTESALPDGPEKFLVVAGTLKPSVREQMMVQAGRSDWPSLCPSHVQVLVTTQPDPEFQFGEGLPRRIYFFSDPPAISDDDKLETNASAATAVATASASTVGPLISLTELYSVQPITTPPKERFTFDSRDDDNNYVNETERYLSRYGL